MACNVDISIENELETIEIPYHIVIKDSKERPFVYSINSDKKVQKKYIELGAFANNKVVVESGLNQGDIVIVEGIYKLEEGEKVEYVLN